ncbi:hypothetical protein HCH04_15170 [Bacteroides thetaiotaomicron]|uniref:hypothetical protein n=1 Tax=Bacteroides thetaiotaomicron TaxID=818 RepID=UPI001C8CD5FA|nr:hypothetical protein [Bacteroides thetaiotaomicron]MBX9049653.1 hypothetical protein [Bacteroides thetaiotaomicron]MBX9072921.1 hypothetical protein [Bacteroides thetaiotaomicron]
MKPTALTIEAIYNLMDSTYTLTNIERTENLNNATELFAECLERKSTQPLNDHINESYVYAQSEVVDTICEELKEKCREQGYIHEEVDIFFDLHEDAIRDEIYSRDNSDIVADLLRNTSDLPVRVELHSNYDCINSHYFEEIYCYNDSYFGAMVDALNLNPIKVKEVLSNAGIVVEDYCPDKRERNGKELADYDQFVSEIANSSAPANLLVFVGTVEARELYDAGFDLKAVTIPNGNVCGIFSSMHGGGSMLEIDLKQDITIKLREKRYDYLSLVLDSDKSNGYSISDVYGVDYSFYGKSIIINQEPA